MGKARMVVGLVAAVVAMSLLAGCGSGDGVSGSGESGGTVKKALPSQLDTETVSVGKKVTSGPWTVEFKKIEKGRKFGVHVADEGTLVMASVALTNETDRALPFVTSDFSLTDLESYTPALEGDTDYDPKGSVEPGKTKTVKAVFYAPPYIDVDKTIVVFQNAAAGDMVRFEAPVK